MPFTSSDFYCRQPAGTSVRRKSGYMSNHTNTSSATFCLGLNWTLIRCLTLYRGQTRQSCSTCHWWHGAALWKYCIISTLLVFRNVTQPRRGQWAAGKQPSCTSQALILRQGPLWPLRKSHRRSLLSVCGGWRDVCERLCLYFCFCATRVYAQWDREGERGTPRERESEGNKKKWSGLVNQVKVQPVAAATAIFFSSVFPDIWRFHLLPF